jgi:large subunit ribosomal protein L24
MVQVIAGEDRGKVGKVLQVLPKKSLVIVERVNFVKRHTKPRRQGQQGGILEKEAPVHMSNCLLFDSKANRGVRVKIERHTDGTFERISQSTGEPLGTS